MIIKIKFNSKKYIFKYNYQLIKFNELIIFYKLNILNFKNIYFNLINRHIFYLRSINANNRINEINYFVIFYF